MGIEVLLVWMESSLSVAAVAAAGLASSSIALMLGLGSSD
jgi:hypothetical protein